MSLPEGPTPHFTGLQPRLPGQQRRGREGRGGEGRITAEGGVRVCGRGRGVAGPPQGSSEARARCPGLASLGPQGRVSGRAAHTATAEAGEEGGNRRPSLSSGQGFLGSSTQAIHRILFVQDFTTDISESQEPTGILAWGPFLGKSTLFRNPPPQMLPLHTG